MITLDIDKYELNLLCLACSSAISEIRRRLSEQGIKEDTFVIKRLEDLYQRLRTLRINLNGGINEDPI